MNDLLTTDDVEARLRRTFSARAGDVPDGDLPADARLGAGALSLSGAGILPPPAPVATDTPGRPARRRAALAAAAALLVAAGATAAVLATGDDTDGDRVTSDEPTTTTAPAPATMRAVYRIGEYERGDQDFFADVGPLVDEPWTRAEGWTPVRVGEHDAWSFTMGGISRLHILVDGLVVTLSGGTPVEDLVAIGGTLAVDPATGRYALTPPEGWLTTSPGTEGLSIPEPGGDPETAPGEPVGRVVDPADPGGRHATVTFHSATYRDDLPDDLDPVTIRGTSAWLEPGGGVEGGLRLWVPFLEGLVEVEATGLSTDEVTAVGAGVETAYLPDEGYNLTAPPGFEVEG
jgi:hypothetical protein